MRSLCVGVCASPCLYVLLVVFICFLCFGLFCFICLLLLLPGCILMTERERENVDLGGWLGRRIWEELGRETCEYIVRKKGKQDKTNPSSHQMGAPSHSLCQWHSPCLHPSVAGNHQFKNWGSCWRGPARKIQKNPQHKNKHVLRGPRRR